MNLFYKEAYKSLVFRRFIIILYDIIKKKAIQNNEKWKKVIYGKIGL